MDYTNVFKNSGRLIWRHKLLWVLGLLLMSGSLPGLVAGHLYLRTVLSFPTSFLNATDPEEFLMPILDIVLNPVILLGGTVVLFVVFILVWMVSTIGEAALIRAVADYEAGQSHSLREMVSAGTGLLARIIAIDTVIFFPLFLILLIQLLTIGGGMIAGTLFLVKPGADAGDLVPVGVIVGLVLLFLTFLSIPVTILSLLFRLVAFRSAVLEDLPTRPSIRRAWELIRAKIGQIIVIFLLLYAVSYALSMVTSLLITPVAIGGSLFFIAPLMEGQLPTQSNIDAFILLTAVISLISIIPGLLYRVFSSAVWTLTYRQWQLD
jgi:hypothetical protein